MKKTHFAVAVLTVCVLMLSGCSKKADAPQPDTEAGQPVEPAARNDVAQQIARELGEAIAQPPTEKMALKVFYAGQEGTDRARDFADFLAANFVQVGRGDYAGFRPEQAAGYDVVILDYDGVDLQSPVPDLSQDYVRATVTVGVPGAHIGSRLGLKTGYL